MNRHDIIAFLKSHKQEMQEKYGVCKIGLFGSYVRDEATEKSDIDIAVELLSENKADNYFNLLHFLEDHFHKKIDLGIESTLRSQIREDVRKEMIYV